MASDARRSQYAEYLRSSAWSSLRVRALLVNGGLCSFCREMAVEIHHIRYPKEFSQDSIFNVQPVCRRHHEEMHGMGNITPLLDYTIEWFEGQKFAIGQAKDDFVGTSFVRWCELFQVPASRRDEAKRYFEDTQKGMARNLLAFNIKLELVRRTDPKTAPLYGWEIARKAMGKLHDVLNEELAFSRATGDEKEIRAYVEGVFRMELKIDSWVKALMRGEVVSLRHPDHAPGTVPILRGMVDALERHEGQLSQHDAAIKELQDPLLPLRKLIEPVSARDALIAMNINHEDCYRQDRGQTIEQAFGNLLKKRWTGPGEPASKPQRMAAEAFSVHRTVKAYPRAHIIACWPEFYEGLAPNSVNF